MKNRTGLLGYIADFRISKGKKIFNENLTHLKLTLSTAIVTNTENDTRTIVNSRYFPNSGTVREVGGIISDSNKKNTPSDRTMEIDNDTFSPESDGK